MSKLVAALVSTTLWACPAIAQTNERAFESLEFRVVTPGARATAMGKAFVGIADDATAAASNPAGLSNLLAPEFSLEWSGATLISNRTLIEGRDPLQFRSRVSYPSFASFVSPLAKTGARSNFTFAGFYNSLQRHRENFAVPNVSRIDGVVTKIPQGGYYGDSDISAQAYGLAGAALVSSRVSLGGALTLQHLSVNAESNTSTTDQPDFFFRRSGSTTLDADNAVSGQVGGLFKATRAIAIGASYLWGTTFNLTTVVDGTFATDFKDERGRQIEDEVFEKHVIDYRIPTRATIGASVRTARNLFITDVSFVQYAQRITPNFLIVDFRLQPSARIDYTLYSFENAVELHSGFEHRFFSRGRLMALRFGFFTDPGHLMRFDQSACGRSNQANSQCIQFNPDHSKDSAGFTGGGGIVYANRVQIDAAALWSSKEREIVVSTVVRFPR